MQHFYYSFVLTLFHSLWQSLLLLAGFYALLFFYKNKTSLFKRNVLFGLLALQIILSLAGFFIIYFNVAFVNLSILHPQLYQINTYNQWPAWLFAGYLLLVGFKTRNLFFEYRKLHILKSESFIKVAPELKIFTRQKALLLGIKKTVTIAYHQYITTPLTYGFFKPVILLPFSFCNAISIADAEALILHELTHIKHKDYLLNLLLPWVQNIFFFNPFIQIIVKNIRLEREKSCDWQVLQFNYEPIAYAEILLQTAKQTHAKQNIFLAAVAKSSQLLKRIQFFSNPNHLVLKHAGNPWLTTTLFLFIGFFSLFIVGNRKQPTTQTVTTFVKWTADKNLSAKNHLTPNLVLLPKTEKESTLIADALPITEAYQVLPTSKEVLQTERISANSLVIDSVSLAVQPMQAIPVHYVEADSLLTREVTVTEEFSGGKKVTKTYLVRLVKGEWYAAPLWMIKEIAAAKDSSKTLLPDSLAPLQLTLLKDSVL